MIPIYITRDKYGDYKIFENEPTLCEDGMYRAAGGCMNKISLNVNKFNLEKETCVKYELAKNEQNT